MPTPPIVGDACERFSDIYRSARGLFLPYTERENLEALFQNATKKNVKVMVVTDGERVLGLGDPGIGGMSELRDFQTRLVQRQSNLINWDIVGDYPSLREVVANAMPSILIGVSGQANLFTEEVVKTLLENCPKPIIFPLSNLSRQVEAIPGDLINWTDGAAIIATGSPFDPATYQGALLPPITDICKISRQIGFVVGKVAQEQGHALSMTDDQLLENIERNFWKPQYRPYKRCSV